MNGRMNEDAENRERLGRMLLNSINGIGPVTLKRLMEQFGSDPWDILKAKQSELMQVRGLEGKLSRYLDKLNHPNG